MLIIKSVIDFRVTCKLSTAQVAFFIAGLVYAGAHTTAMVCEQIGVKM